MVRYTLHVRFLRRGVVLVDHSAWIFFFFFSLFFLGFCFATKLQSLRVEGWLDRAGSSRRNWEKGKSWAPSFFFPMMCNLSGTFHEAYGMYFSRILTSAVADSYDAEYCQTQVHVRFRRPIWCRLWLALPIDGAPQFLRLCVTEFLPAARAAFLLVILSTFGITFSHNLSR